MRIEGRADREIFAESGVGERASVLRHLEKAEAIVAVAAVEKPGGEFGTILRLTDNRLEIGDKLEGDFESINAIRPMKNLASGEDIMMRGVRYSTSRKYVLQVMPKWCKAPKE